MGAACGCGEDASLASGACVSNGPRGACQEAEPVSDLMAERQIDRQRDRQTDGASLPSLYLVSSSVSALVFCSLVFIVFFLFCSFGRKLAEGPSYYLKLAHVYMERKKMHGKERE